MTITLSCCIMAHPSRGEEAISLAQQVGARIVWDEHDDEWDTGSRALAAYDVGATHQIVLQDDAVPVDGFLEHAAAAIAEHPAEPISFYLGRTYPTWAPRWVRPAISRADKTGAAWLSDKTLLHGVALALPVYDIGGLLRWAHDRREPYDERIGKWYRDRGHRIMYTWPSLVDHADTDPVIQRRADKQRRNRGPRVAYRTGAPTRWDTPVEVIR